LCFKKKENLQYREKREKAILSKSISNISHG